MNTVCDVSMFAYKYCCKKVLKKKVGTRICLFLAIRKHAFYIGDYYHCVGKDKQILR